MSITEELLKTEELLEKLEADRKLFSRFGLRIDDYYPGILASMVGKPKSYISFGEETLQWLRPLLVELADFQNGTKGAKNVL